MAFINGWGRGTWGQLGWGEGSIPVEPTGVEATGIVNGVGVNAQAVASVGGVTATLGTVSVTINADANVDTAGLGLTSALGTLTSVTGKANISPTGQEGTSALGTVTPEAQAIVSIPNSLVATLGNVSVLVDAEATVIITTGVAATGAVGTITTRTVNRFEIHLSGATTSLGAPTVIAKADVTLTGVSATGVVSNLNVWGLVDDAQNPNWVEVAA